MTRTEMLAYVRTYLDEVSEAYYLDDEEIYPMLTRAQYEIIQLVCSKWYEANKNRNGAEIPLVLQGINAEINGFVASGQREITVANMIMPIHITWNPTSSSMTTFPNAQKCIWISPADADRLTLNPLHDDGYYAWRIRSTVIRVNPYSTNANASYLLTYIKTPDYPIDATHDAGIHEVGHQAICERALWLLMKDQESSAQLATAHEAKADKLIQGLLQ